MNDLDNIDLRKGDEIAFVEPGSHVCVLASVEVRERKKWESEELEQVLTFKYVTHNEEGEPVTIWRDCKPVLGERTNLQKDLMMMAGSRFQKVKDDLEAVKGLIKSLVHKKYFVSVELRQTKTGKTVNKFVSVAQIPAAMQEKETSDKTIEANL